MAFYVQTNQLNIPNQMSVPNLVNIPNSANLHAPVKIAPKVNIPNQNNIPQQVNVQKQVNKPKRANEQNQNNIPNQANIPSEHNIPGQFIPHQINLPNIIVPNQINVPNQIIVPNHNILPNQIIIPNQTNLPNQFLVPNPINVPSHIHIPTHFHVPTEISPNQVTVLNCGVEQQQTIQQNVVYVEKNLCRICGSTSFPIMDLFGPLATENCLVQKINKYLPIMVEKDDYFPLWICDSCANTLLNWDKFVDKCRTTDKMLSQELDPPSKSGKTTNKQASGTSGNNDPGWPPRVGGEPICSEQDDSNTVRFLEHKTKDDFYEIGGSDGLASDDDQPLANIATKKPSDLFQNFYTALTKFRNHFLKDHDRSTCHYSDFSDSSVSENDDVGGGEDLNNFDDLTHSNMRKDKMDEETRLELSQVQTKINGKVFFTCTTCGKNLSSTHTYIFHKRIHTGERPCVCHICGKQFRAPNGLQRHLTETHEKQRRYICVMCTKNFANSQNLKQHIRIHTGERPFVCPHCGKRFTQSGSLHVHLKTHSEHFPFSCAECGAQFRLRAGLARHRLKHSGERPHACALCGKAFRQRHELAAHALAHSDAKPHACALCGAAFRQRRALRHHCKRLHDAQPRARPYEPWDPTGDTVVSSSGRNGPV